MKDTDKSAELHPLLLKQMRRAGVMEAVNALPEPMQKLLERVSQSYADAEQDRYLLERSLDVSSREMHYSIEMERNHLQTIVSTTDDCICMLNTNGCVTWANPAALRTLELDPDEPASFCFSARTEPMLAGGSARDGYAHKSRAFLRNLAGSLIPIAYTRSYIATEQGCSVLAFSDISADLAHELALIQAREAADAASQAKTQLLDNVSHELRTPMHGILGMLQLLEQSNLDRESSLYLKNLRYSADALQDLLNNLLEFSRKEAGTIKLESVPFPLNSLAEGVRDLIVPEATGKGLETRLVFTGEAMPKLVMGDPARLCQVLLNLARNAVKFTSSGFVEIAVHASHTSATQVQLTFHVRDSGIGIPASQHQSIFESFSQADNSATRKFGGAGLGLSICREILNSMGASISLESQPGYGSDFQFTLSLPVHHDSVDQSMPRAVLYAEDNPINQLTVLKMLGSKGHQIDIVTDGRRAIAAVSEKAYDLILMDNQMPELSGIEATRALRAMGCVLPIIAVTASTHPEDREKLLAAGMDEFLAKPFTLAQLQSAIERGMENAKQSSRMPTLC